MTLGRSKNDIRRIVGTSFAPEKNMLTFFAVIASKPIEIVFKQTNDNIKDFDKKYVIT